MGTLTARFFRKPSSPGVVVIRQDSNGYLWDFTNSVFTDTPALDYQAPTEDTDFPGMYLFQLVQSWTGLYQVFWYPTSAKAGKPLVLAINLTSGAQDDVYGDLAESVRLELDANSTQLAAIAEDTAALTTTIADSYAGDGNRPTLLQAALGIYQFLFDRSVSGTSVTVYKEDGTTTAMTLTLDSASNPTSVHQTTNP